MVYFNCIIYIYIYIYDIGVSGIHVVLEHCFIVDI
jgi:hypothetical protein